MTVYLLHFSSGYKGAGHYIGWCKDVKEPDHRLQEHLDGDGNPLVKAAADAGADVVLARVWPAATRGFERWLKNLKGVGKRACPICLGRTPAGRTNGYEPPAPLECRTCGGRVSLKGSMCEPCWKRYRENKDDNRPPDPSTRSVANLAT